MKNQENLYNTVDKYIDNSKNCRYVILHLPVLITFAV